MRSSANSSENQLSIPCPCCDKIYQLKSSVVRHLKQNHNVTRAFIEKYAEKVTEMEKAPKLTPVKPKMEIESNIIESSVPDREQRYKRRLSEKYKRKSERKSDSLAQFSPLNFATDQISFGEREKLKRVIIQTWKGISASNYADSMKQNTFPSVTHNTPNQTPMSSTSMVASIVSAAAGWLRKTLSRSTRQSAADSSNSTPANMSSSFDKSSRGRVASVSDSPLRPETLGLEKQNSSGATKKERVVEYVWIGKPDIPGGGARTNTRSLALNTQNEILAHSPNGMNVPMPKCLFPNNEENLVWYCECCGSFHCLTSNNILCPFQKKHGFRVVDVPSDGDCFYRCVQECLSSDPTLNNSRKNISISQMRGWVAEECTSEQLEFYRIQAEAAPNDKHFDFLRIEQGRKRKLPAIENNSDEYIEGVPVTTSKQLKSYIKREGSQVGPTGCLWADDFAYMVVSERLKLTILLIDMERQKGCLPYRFLYRCKHDTDVRYLVLKRMGPAGHFQYVVHGSEAGVYSACFSDANLPDVFRSLWKLKE